MSQPNQTNPNPDDLLADFTDRVLDGKASAPESSADVELRGLEETVLRLQQTLPQEVPDPKTLTHLQANFKARVRKANAPTSSFWQSLQPRQRFALAFAGVALATLLVAFPFLTSSNNPVQGTAGFQSQGVILLAGIGGVILLLVWVSRHK